MKCELTPQRRSSLVFAAVAVGLLAVRCTTPTARGPMPEIEVLLQRGAADVRLGLDGPYRVTDRQGHELGSGKRLAGARVAADGNGLDLNGFDLGASKIVLRPTDDDPFEFGGKRYAGDLAIERDNAGKLEVHGLLDIEEYLAGVLFSEMPSSFPRAALEAQAVAARTYALYRKSHGDPLLRSTDADQVYGGLSTKQALARECVAATRGVVLEVDGATLCAYFMSTCGGATVDAPAVFPGSGRAGLIGVPCDFCRESPKYRWERSIGLNELARRLGVTAPLNAITPRRDAFGHSLSFAVDAASGDRTFAGQEFRRAWNSGASDAEKLPSSWLLDLDFSRDSLHVRGAGFGHGVGLCQYGAAGLAKQGRSWREILEHYYRGAKLVRRW